MTDQTSGLSRDSVRKPYTSPRLRRWGSIAELTQVGQTNPGSDLLPGQARGRESGSITNAGGR